MLRGAVDLDVLVVTDEAPRQLGWRGRQQTPCYGINATLQCGVGRIGQRVTWTGKSIEDPSARIAAQPDPAGGKRRIETGIRKQIEKIAVVADSPPSTNNGFIVEAGRSPRKSETRCKILLIGIIELANLCHMSIDNAVWPRNVVAQVVILFADRCRVLVPQAYVQSEILAEFPVVLHEEVKRSVAKIKVAIRSAAGERIDVGGVLEERSVVTQGQDVVEGVFRARGLPPETVVLFTDDLSPELQEFVAELFANGIAKFIGIFDEDLGHSWIYSILQAPAGGEP